MLILKLLCFSLKIAEVSLSKWAYLVSRWLTPHTVRLQSIWHNLSLFLRDTFLPVLSPVDDWHELIDHSLERLPDHSDPDISQPTLTGLPLPSRANPWTRRPGIKSGAMMALARAATRRLPPHSEQVPMSIPLQALGRASTP